MQTMKRALSRSTSLSIYFGVVTSSKTPPSGATKGGGRGGYTKKKAPRHDSTRNLPLSSLIWHKLNENFSMILSCQRREMTGGVQPIVPWSLINLENRPSPYLHIGLWWTWQVLQIWKRSPQKQTLSYLSLHRVYCYYTLSCSSSLVKANGVQSPSDNWNLSNIRD